MHSSHSLFSECTSIPAAFLPCRRLRARGGCTCNSWKTSAGRRQQTRQPLRTPPGPASSEEGTRQRERVNERHGGMKGRGSCSYSDGAQVHWLLDDVVVVVKAQSHHVDGDVEGPRVRVVSLREHFLQHVAAALERCRQSDLLVLTGKVFAGSFDGPSAAPPAAQRCRRGVVLSRGRLTADDCRRGHRCTIGFPL